MKTMLKTLLKNKMFWIYVSLATVFVFGIILQFENCEWAIYPIFAAFGYCAIIGLIMIVYAWIINPIKSLFK